MTRDDILRMAREAGFYFHDAGYAPILHTTRNEYSEKCFERFAALVAAAEREACAKVCVANELIDWPTTVEIAAVCKCATTIRARNTNA